MLAAVFSGGEQPGEMLQQKVRVILMVDTGEMKIDTTERPGQPGQRASDLALWQVAQAWADA